MGSPSLFPLLLLPQLQPFLILALHLTWFAWLLGSTSALYYVCHQRCCGYNIVLALSAVSLHLLALFDRFVRTPDFLSRTAARICST